MATNKELKALITLAGKIDPSLQQSLLKAQKETKKTSFAMSLMGKMGSGALGIVKTGAKAAMLGIAGLAATGGAALFQMGKTGLAAASDLSEIQNVVDVTFGDSSVKVDAWSKSLLNGYGLGELSAKKYTSTMGAMLKSSGIVGDDMLTMSQNVTMLTGDMASFHNLKPDEMFEKLRSGISGETEPLKQLGINMSAANLEAFALSQGIEASYSSMSEAEKTALRYNYIMHTTKDAQDDFAHTSGTLSNQQKLLTENFTQLSAKIMTSATPAIASMMQGLNGFMSSMNTDALGSFVGKIGELAVQLMPIAMSLLPVIQNTMTTLLPPLLEIIRIVLPPITKFLGFVVEVAGAALGKMAEIIGKIADFFASGGNKKSIDTSKGFPKLALGGFANRPSICGEAGLEAAIPIKPGNPQSIMLLQKTAKLLHVKSNEVTSSQHMVTNLFGPTSVKSTQKSSSVDLQNSSTSLFDQVSNVINQLATPPGMQFIYSPTISGVPAESLQPILRQNMREIEQMLERKMNLKRRISFGTA